MANFDGTGPNGLGPMTGRGMGYCGGRRGQCIGRGMGRGFGYRRQITLTKDEEKKILEEDLKEIELEKKEIENRLKEI